MKEARAERQKAESTEYTIKGVVEQLEKREHSGRERSPAGFISRKKLRKEKDNGSCSASTCSEDSEHTIDFMGM